ncbi:MAG TPA: hypothetical protein VJK48_05075 [Chlamydiales bacterium]|nr:hypothetical protein [Chlamydiales bacterium]
MKKPTVTFATSCWEKDWRQILLHPHYLPIQQIANHRFPFQEKILVINNVVDLSLVTQAAKRWLDHGVLSHVVAVDGREEEILSYFGLKRSDFATDWQFHNAMGPLTALFSAKSDYLLYVTGDVRLEKEVDWIGKALSYMEKNRMCKVANLTWNDNFKEAKKEAYKTNWNFYVSKEGFSDQMFLVQRKEFTQPIYQEIRSDASHFPRGDVWEKRVFSYMKNRGWERITYRWGAYTHENFV